MKYLLILFFTINNLSAETTNFNNYLYSFSDKGAPVSRVTKDGFIQVPFYNTYVDIKFKEAINLNMFNDDEFKKLDEQTKIKYITKYFEKEIKPKILNLSENEISRHLEILKIVILNQ